MIVSFILAAVFLVIGILLLCGKCGWLISGYNTLYPEEKEKADKKKVFTAVGYI